MSDERTFTTRPHEPSPYFRDRCAATPGCDGRVEPGYTMRLAPHEAQVASWSQCGTCGRLWQTRGPTGARWQSANTAAPGT